MNEILNLKNKWQNIKESIAHKNLVQKRNQTQIIFMCPKGQQLIILVITLTF